MAKAELIRSDRKIYPEGSSDIINSKIDENRYKQKYRLIRNILGVIGMHK